MSRPRRKLQAVVPASGEALASPEVVPQLPAETAVTVLTECILFGKRYSKGQRISIPTERVDDLFNGGLTVSEAQVDAIWAAAGRILTPNIIGSHYEAVPYNRNALKVLQLTSYDPGSSVYRYHSAANTVPGVVSAFARYGHSNPHCDLRQWDTEIDERNIRVLAMTADVIHSHMDYYVLRNMLRLSTGAWKNARTYHGSVDPQNPKGSIYVNKDDEDTKMGAVLFGARPYHHRFGVQNWLPIPMPVKDYKALRKGYLRNKTLRVAHSPTVRRIKGTQELLAAVDYLKMHEGYDIELVLIENMAHGDALQLKATCDVVFDSFWLGMQGSGLEGAAMGMPVIAGDPDAQNDLMKLGIPVPWTIANDGQELRDQLRRLAHDSKFYTAEAKRVHEYVLAYHDYPVVGAKYVKILREATNGVANSQ